MADFTWKALKKRPTNIYSDVIFPSLSNEMVNPLIFTGITKRQLQPLKEIQKKLNRRIANYMLTAFNQATD